MPFKSKAALVKSLHGETMRDLRSGVQLPPLSTGAFPVLLSFVQAEGSVGEGRLGA